MKRIALFIILNIYFLQTTSGQYRFEAIHLPIPGKGGVFKTTESEVWPVSTGGTNLSWSIPNGNVILDDSTRWLYKIPEESKGNSYFPNANISLEKIRYQLNQSPDTVYEFYQKTSSRLTLLGSFNVAGNSATIKKGPAPIIICPLENGTILNDTSIFVEYYSSASGDSIQKKVQLVSKFQGKGSGTININGKIHTAVYLSFNSNEYTRYYKYDTVNGTWNFWEAPLSINTTKRIFLNQGLQNSIVIGEEKTNENGTYWKINYCTSDPAIFTLLSEPVIREIQSLYPNPSHQSFFISGVPIGCPYRIIDGFGRQVTEGYWNGIEIDTRYLKDGIYSIQIPDKKGSFKSGFRFFVNHE